MLGAIYIGLSGLKAYSKGLQTISNNVANLNSTGFKATTVNFTDLFTHDGGGDSNAAAQQGSGDGVRIGTPTVDFKQGDLRASDGDLDLAIDGNGFLTLLNGDDLLYARTGQFTVDAKGYIVQQGTENRLGVLDAGGGLTALNIDDKRTNAPLATTKISLEGNLSSTATDASVNGVAIYDSRGNKQVWNIAFAKASVTGSTNEWTVTVKDGNGATVGTGSLKFIGNIVDPATATLVFTSAPEGADPLNVTLDFSGNVTSFSSGTTSSIKNRESDGRALGTLTTTTLDESGRVKLSYSNGESATLSAIAVADFRDPQQLERSSNGLFRDNARAAHRLLMSGTDGAGKIVSRQIEASNVDLSAEFGDLILVQRGYQASSQVISTANDMIQQLFGIRGQG